MPFINRPTLKSSISSTTYVSLPYRPTREWPRLRPHELPETRGRGHGADPLAAEGPGGGVGARMPAGARRHPEQRRQQALPLEAESHPFRYRLVIGLRVIERLARTTSPDIVRGWCPMRGAGTDSPSAFAWVRNGIRAVFLEVRRGRLAFEGRRRQGGATVTESGNTRLPWPDMTA